MAYDASFPADDSYLSDFPAGDREQNRALKDDQIVNAGKLQGLTAGNKNGQIPINNGTENANLNAALLNGKASSYFATSNHSHTTATQSSNGYMSNSDKKKLDGIASGAEVNQNAFANVKVGTTTIQADAKQDTLTLAAGTNIALTPDGNNDKVTIGVTGKVASASKADSATNANNLIISSGTSCHIKYGGGDVDESTAISQNKVNLLIGSWYSTGFRDLCSSGTPIRVAINHRNGNIKTTGRVTASGGFSGNLSGTATNATNATNATRLSNKGNISATTLPNSLTTGLTTHAAYNNSYPAMYGNVINIYHSGKSQLLLEWKGDDTAAADPGHLYYRECRDNQNAWSNWKTVAFTTDNVSSATKATQDKNGRDITGYLYKSESLSLSSSASIVSSGTISAILNAFCTKFKNIQGTNAYGDSPPTTLKSLNDNKAPKASPAFSGSPTAPTPGTTDNSTRVATTNFVRNLLNSSTFGTIVASSLNTNGYVKFSNGLIVQWGITTSGSRNGVTFPISFGTIFSITMGNLGNNAWTPYFKSVTNTKFIATIEGSAYDYKGYWIAIGK